MSTNIYVNGKFLTQATTGVQRYAIELTRALLAQHPAIKIIIPLNSVLIDDSFSANIIRTGSLKGVLWEQINLPRYAKKNQAFLLNLCNVAPVFYKNKLLIIHDLGVYVNPKWYNWKFVLWYKLITPLTIQNSKLIGTVSETVKNEIINRFKIDSTKVLVVYNSIAACFVNEISEKENYILHVGTLSDRKNIRYIIENFNLSNCTDYTLVFIGNHDDLLTYHLDDVATENILFITNATDIDLANWYLKAKFVISASQYEGFGIPVLEGLVNHSVAILSSIPVYKELYKNGCVFFNLEDQDELQTIFNSLSAINKNQTFAKEYIERYNIHQEMQKIVTCLNNQK
ncbi:MAG: glycosyltransferase family 4 protein [Crocinitomicaceae bacterium]|nr:glycosyltransferase family 4 protein [Crocinitomicaceae bacterium]